MKLNPVIQVNHTYVRDSYYYEGKLYEDSINGRKELIEDYIDDIKNGSSTSNLSKTMYTFNNLEDDLIYANNKIDNELGIYSSKEGLSDSIIADLETNSEQSKYVASSVKSFSDEYLDGN